MRCHNHEHCKTRGEPTEERWFTLFQLEPDWTSTPNHAITFCSLYCVSHWTHYNSQRTSLEALKPDN